MQTVDSEIRAAINGRLRLSFDYDGHPRVVEPYCYGVSHAGNEVLRAIQVGGTSASGGFGFGKLWILERMMHVRTRADSFVPNDPKYNPNDSAMATIYCRV